MSDNIHVAVRVRPLISREIKEDAQIHWKAENTSVISLASSPSTAFCFDRVFDARETNDVVYGELCSPLVESVMQGINGTIFAYGQTSSGKTFTMMGDAKNSGIIRSTIEDIFNAIENMPNREFLLRVSYMEIYNEMVVDLLSTEEKKNLKVQENTDGYISICGLEEIVIRSTHDVFNWMKKGERKRHIGETNMNERSSRSHTIFRMIIESRGRDTVEESAVIVSQFNFVDLAGSERAAEMFTTDRFKESVSINKSLFTLSQVISQLSENDGQHISYRASKLTRILKNSLGGNARTVIICAVTPASLDQTLSTLKFASRAKCIKNKPQVNEILTGETPLKRYARKIKELTKQLEGQQNGDVKAMQLELEEKDRKIENLRQSLREIKEKLVVSHNPPEKFSAIPRNQRRETWGGSIMKQNLTPPPLDNIKSFCHLPVLPTLGQKSFSAIADLSSEFSPEYLEDLLSGGSKFLSSSPRRRSLSSSRSSFPRSTVHVEVQTENCLGNITDSDVPTDFGRAAFLGIKEEISKLRSVLESTQKIYEELRDFTCLDKEIRGTDNGWTNEIKGEQDGSGKDKIEQLTQELVDEKLKNEKLLEGLKHWAEKAESYKLQVRHLKEAKECTTSLDKLPKAVTTEESLSDKPSDEIVYYFQNGAIANSKLYMMDSELYQKNKELDRLKKEIDRLKSVISSKRTSISTKPGQNAAGVSTDQQPTETHVENPVPVFVKPTARKRSENDIQGNIKKQKLVRRSSEVESENAIVTFVKPKPRAQSENGVSQNKPSEARSENTKPAFTFSSRVQTEVTAKGEKDIISTVKKPEAQNQSTVHNGNDITSMTKNPQGTPNGNIPTVFVRPSSRTHDKITVQIQNDLPSALKTSGQNITPMLPSAVKTSGQDFTPLFTKPGPLSQSDIDVSVVNKPSLLQNENGPPSSAQHRPRASSESKTQSKNEGPSTMSEVENESMPFTFLKHSSAQNENGVNGKSLQPHRENIPPTLGRARHKVQSENGTPLGTRLSSQIQRNDVSLCTKPLSEEQRGNPCSASVEPLPSTVNRNIVASEKLQSERESTKTVSESVKSFSTMQNVDSVATTKPLTELQAVRNYEKPVSLVDTSGSNATKMVRDGFSTELKKSAAVPTDKVPQRGKRKFNESNECKQQ